MNGSPSPVGSHSGDAVLQIKIPPVFLNASPTSWARSPKLVQILNGRRSYLGRACDPPPRMNQRRQMARSIQRLSSDMARGNWSAGRENLRKPSSHLVRQTWSFATSVQIASAAAGVGRTGLQAKVQWK